MTRALVVDVSIFARFKVNCEVMPQHSLPNFKLAISRHRKELRRAQPWPVCKSATAYEGHTLNDLLSF